MVRRNPEVDEALKTLQKLLKDSTVNLINPFKGINPFAQFADSIKYYQQKAPESLIELSKYGGT